MTVSSGQNKITDCLNHEQVAGRVASILGAVPLPLNVLLYGSWGTGKATFLSFLKGALDNTGKFHVVHFNPWAYESTPNLLVPLLKAIYESLSTEDDKSKARNVAIDCLRVALDIGVRVASKSLSGGLIDLKLQDIKESLEGDEQTALDKLVDEVKVCQEKFGDLVNFSVRDGNKQALVVLLDDLDRCLPDNVIALIEGIKLYLTQEAGVPVVFVWAMDREVVSDAVGAKYDLRSFRGKDYLEKIFDFQFPVPALTQELLDNLVRSFVKDMPQPGLITLFGDDYESEIPRCLDVPPLRNPRTLSRICNMIRVLTMDAGEVRNKADYYEIDKSAFAQNLLLGLIIAYHFRERRFSLLHITDRWKSFIDACRGDSPDSQQTIRENYELAEVLAKNMGIKFDSSDGPRGMSYKLWIDNDNLTELYKMSQLIQQFGF